jgi:hypothetical protein
VQCRNADCIPGGFYYLKLQLIESAATVPGVANDGAPKWPVAVLQSSFEERTK